MATKEVIVADENDIHMLSTKRIADAAVKFPDTEIIISKGDKEANFGVLSEEDLAGSPIEETGFDLLAYGAVHPYVINMIERYKRVRKYIDMSDEEFKGLINPDHIYYNFLTIRLLNGEEISLPTYRIKHELAAGPGGGAFVISILGTSSRLLSILVRIRIILMRWR